MPGQHTAYERCPSTDVSLQERILLILCSEILARMKGKEGTYFSKGTFRIE